MRKLNRVIAYIPMPEQMKSRPINRDRFPLTWEPAWHSRLRRVHRDNTSVRVAVATEGYPG